MEIEDRQLDGLENDISSSKMNLTIVLCIIPSAQLPAVLSVFI